MNRQITNHRLEAGVARRFKSREYESYLPHEPGSVPLKLIGVVVGARRRLNW